MINGYIKKDNKNKYNKYKYMSPTQGQQQT